MTPTQTFLLALGLGSALVAFWLVVRFPTRGPGDMRRALMHVGAALGVGWFAPTIFGAVASGNPTRALVAVFLVVFPVLVYTFLSGAWFLKLAHAAISHHRH